MFTYLASPYTHDDPAVRQKRYEDVMEVVSVFVLKNEGVYSPVLHFHPLVVKHAIPTDYDFWEDLILSMLRRARDLVIVKIDGWETSVGLREEYLYARRLNMPVFESKSVEEYKAPLSSETW